MSDAILNKIFIQNCREFKVNNHFFRSYLNCLCPYRFPMSVNMTADVRTWIQKLLLFNLEMSKNFENKQQEHRTYCMQRPHFIHFIETMDFVDLSDHEIGKIWAKHMQPQEDFTRCCTGYRLFETKQFNNLKSVLN